MLTVELFTAFYVSVGSIVVALKLIGIFCDISYNTYSHTVAHILWPESKLVYHCTCTVYHVDLENCQHDHES